MAPGTVDAGFTSATASTTHGGGGSRGEAVNGDAGAGTDAEQAMRAMEDLSLRMSKKVAQLTKVIYHLNTRNEEQVFDLQDMSEHYETEMELILRDTAERISSFRQQAEERAGEERAAKAVKQLRVATETRCLTLEAEFKLYRQRTEERVAVARREAQARVDALVTEVETVKRGFKEQLQAMEEASVAARDSALASSGVLDEAKHVRRKHDEVKVQLERSIADADTAKRAAAAAEELHRREAERLHDEVGQLREEREKGMQDASTLERRCVTAERELNEAMREVKVLRDDLAASRSSVEALSRSAEEREALLAAELKVKSVELGNEEKRGRLLTDELVAAQDGMKNSEGVIASLILRREELEGELASEKKAREALEAHAARVTASSTAEHKKLEQRASELQEKLSSLILTSESETASLKAKVGVLEKQLEVKTANAVDSAALASQRSAKAKDLELELGAAREQLKSTHVQLRASSEEKSRLKLQLGELSVLLKQTKDDGAASAADTGERMKALYEKKMTQMRKDHLRQLDETLANHKDTIASLNEEHAKKLAVREETLKEAMADMKREYDAERGSMTRGVEDEKMRGEEQVNKVRIEMKQKVAELLQRLADEEKQCEIILKEANTVRGEKDSVEKELADYKAKLDDALHECRRLADEGAAVRANFNTSAESWREEKEGAQEAYTTLRQLFENEKRMRAEDAASALVKLNDELERSAENWRVQADERAAEAVKLREAELELVTKDKMDVFAAKHTFELEGLRKEMLDALAKRDEVNEEERIFHESALAAVRAEHGHAMDVLSADHASSLKDAGDDHRRQTELLRSDHKDEVEALARAHGKALAELREQNRTEVASMDRSRRAALEALEASSSAKLESTVKAMDRAKAEALDTLRMSLTQSHSDAVAALNAEGTARISGLQTKIVDLERDLAEAAQLASARDAHIVDLETDADGLRGDVASAKAETERTVTTMCADRAASETKLTEEYESRLKERSAAHLEVKAGLEEEMSRRDAAHDAEVEEMRGAYEALKHRFETRESRPEDLERIADLERHVSEVNEKLGTQEERLRALKVEMRNREESYNVKFANDPKVMSEGMPWLKSKTGRTGKADAGSSSTTRNTSARTRRASTLY